MIRKAIWGEHDPYASLPDVPEDLQGWRIEQPLLWEAIEGAQRIAEIGVWKGFTTIEMARRSSAEILAVDHFRGSSEHFLRSQWKGSLASLYDTFRINVVASGFQDRITPLPLDSRAAWEVCMASGLSFDVIHIDGAHDRDSVLTDIRSWAQMTNRMVLDDYGPGWPGVVQAAEQFCAATAWRVAGEQDGKALLEKAERN